MLATRLLDLVPFPRRRPAQAALLLVFALLVGPTRPANIVSSQLTALTALYDATAGAGWSGNYGNRNWLTGDPCNGGNWGGVSCDSSGNVNWLLLNNNGMTGTLPTEMGLFTSLVYL